MDGSRKQAEDCGESMKVKKYVCPICHKEYHTYQQAERCLDDCKDNASVEEFVCNFEDLHGYEIDSIIGKCTSCEHCDGEGTYFADCPLKATGEKREGCAAYIPAHDLHTVCSRYNYLQKIGQLPQY
jgi:hypothetical protein